jgi:Tfp pilus assembly protein PilX
MRAVRRVAANQRGIALLSVLGLLAVLLVLASLVAGSSRVESALSGTARRSAQAFQAADAGLGYALGDADNFVQLATRCTSLGTTGPCTTAGLPVSGTVNVTYKYSAPPPIEIHVSALRFVGFYFDVAATGTAPTNATSALDMMATRLGPAQ